MVSEESRQGEELNSSMDTSTDDAGANEDAREARRLRREQRKEEEDDPSLLDVTDDEEERGLPTTRAKAQREEDTEAATEAVTAGLTMAPPPPPPPLPPVWVKPAETAGQPFSQEKKTKPKKKQPKYVNAVFNKVEINIVKASPGANPSGGPGNSMDARPNSSSGLASSSANSCSADELLFGHSEKTNGAYKAVFATRQSLRVNPDMDEAGGDVPREGFNWVLCQQGG
jgi:hypothetical protein